MPIYIAGGGGGNMRDVGMLYIISYSLYITFVSVCVRGERDFSYFAS